MMSTFTVHDVANSLKEFICSNFPLAAQEGISDSDLLLEEGIVDSLGVLEIVDYVEQTYGISIGDADMVLDNFGSIEIIASFIVRSLNPG